MEHNKRGNFKKISRLHVMLQPRSIDTECALFNLRSFHMQRTFCVAISILFTFVGRSFIKMLM